MIKASLFNIVFLGSLLSCSNCFLQAKANRIAVKAQASEIYLIDRAQDASKKIQTYHLLKGKYFGGNVADRNMESVTFMEMAQEIANNLRRQNFISASDVDEGDLLIMIHYGSTNVRDDLHDILGSNSTYFPEFNEQWSGPLYRYELSQNLGPQFRSAGAFSRLRLQERYFISSLLGMEEVFSWKIDSYKAHILKGLINERRYFFVLTAFDFPLLRTGEKKVVWSTRYSVRSIGQPFDQAVKELNAVAGHFFGKNLKGLNHKRATDKSLVQLGEIEVIGVEPSVVDMEDLGLLLE